jgi:predicted Na+-dependent transporter
MAVLNTINMGCALDMAIVKQNILRPVGPIVGFISQFTFMPLVSSINQFIYFISFLFNYD